MNRNTNIMNALEIYSGNADAAIDDLLAISQFEDYREQAQKDILSIVSVLWPSLGTVGLGRCAVCKEPAEYRGIAEIGTPAMPICKDHAKHAKAYIKYVSG